MATKAAFAQNRFDAISKVSRCVVLLRYAGSRKISAERRAANHDSEHVDGNFCRVNFHQAGRIQEGQRRGDCARKSWGKHPAYRHSFATIRMRKPATLSMTRHERRVNALSGERQKRIYHRRVIGSIGPVRLNHAKGSRSEDRSAYVVRPVSGRIPSATR